MWEAGYDEPGHRLPHTGDLLLHPPVKVGHEHAVLVPRYVGGWGPCGWAVKNHFPALPAINTCWRDALQTNMWPVRLYYQSSCLKKDYVENLKSWNLLLMNSSGLIALINPMVNIPCRDNSKGIKHCFLNLKEPKLNTHINRSRVSKLNIQIKYSRSMILYTEVLSSDVFDTICIKNYFQKNKKKEKCVIYLRKFQGEERTEIMKPF